MRADGKLMRFVLLNRLEVLFRSSILNLRVPRNLRFTKCTLDQILLVRNYFPDYVQVRNSLNFSRPLRL
jgi:hypothetical protein